MSDTPRTDEARIATGFQAVPDTFLWFAKELERENAALRAALSTWLAWEDAGGDIPPSAARHLFRIARAAIDAARKDGK